jgi:hypothetical protein
MGKTQKDLMNDYIIRIILFVTYVAFTSWIHISITWLEEAERDAKIARREAEEAQEELDREREKYLDDFGGYYNDSQPFPVLLFDGLTDRVVMIADRDIRKGELITINLSYED